MGVVVNGVGDGHWHITPDVSTGMVEVALVVRGQRFVADLSPEELSAVEKVLVELPDAPRDGHPKPMDLSAEFRRVIGRDPFEARAEVRRRPWLRRLFP